MKNIFLIILLFCFTLTWSAPLYTSTADGDWTVGSTWDIGIPTHNKTTTGDSISIESYVTLTDLLDVKTGTTLIVRAGDTLKIDGDVIFENGSTVIIEAGAVLWVTGNITNQNSSNTISIDGTLVINGNFVGGMGSEINGSGSMEIDGTVTTTGTGSVFGSTDDCGSGDCSSSAGAPLPIRLISFEAYVNTNSVQLKWITATEINNDFFTLEKNKDGKIWENISTIDGAGNSNQLIEYSDTDRNPFEGTSYYRLKQADFNGDFGYSNIISINFTRNDNIILRLFPNPVLTGENLIIVLESTENLETLVVLRDVRGQVFYSKKVVNKDGNRMLSIPINNKIPPGTYIIKTTSNKQFYSKKVIIK